MLAMRHLEHHLRPARRTVNDCVRVRVPRRRLSWHAHVVADIALALEPAHNQWRRRRLRCWHDDAAKPCFEPRKVARGILFLRVQPRHDDEQVVDLVREAARDDLVQGGCSRRSGGVGCFSASAEYSPKVERS